MHQASTTPDNTIATRASASQHGHVGGIGHPL